MKRILLIAVFLINSIISAYDLNDIEIIFSSSRITQIPDIAKNMSATGTIHHSKGEYIKAIEFYNNSLILRERIGLSKSYGFATVLFLLGIAKDKSGDSCNAILPIQKAMNLYRYLGKEEDSRIAEEEITNVSNNCKTNRNKIAIEN